MKASSFILILLLSISCREEPSPSDPRDQLVGEYQGIPMRMDADLKPVPVLDHVIIRIAFEKAEEPDAFTLLFGSERLKCIDLQQSASGFSFRIPDQEFNSFGAPGRYAGSNQIELDGAMHEGVFVVEGGLLKFLVKTDAQVMVGQVRVAFIWFSGSRQ
jgi:hypothetical protein